MNANRFVKLSIILGVLFFSAALSLKAVRADQAILFQGINIISIPGATASDLSPCGLLYIDSTTRVGCTMNANGYFVYYNPYGGNRGDCGDNYFSAPSMAPGLGYLVAVSNACAINYTMPANESFALIPGMNIVSVPGTTTEDQIASVCGPKNLIFDYFTSPSNSCTYDNAGHFVYYDPNGAGAGDCGNNFYSTSTMRPPLGYKVMFNGVNGSSTAPCTLTFANGQLVGAPNPTTTTTTTTMKTTTTIPQASDMAGFWRFEKDMKDVSGNGNNGNASGVSYVPGVYGYGAAFDRAGEFAAVPDNKSLDLTRALTIEAYIYPRSFGEGGFGRIVDKDSSSYIFYIRNGTGYNSQLVAYLGGQEIKSNNGAIKLGKWQLVALTFNASAPSQQVKLYVDGRLVGTGTRKTGIGTNSKPLYIGNKQGLGRTFNGVIDELKMFKRALSPSDIAVEYGRINITDINHTVPTTVPTTVPSTTTTGMTTTSSSTTIPKTTSTLPTTTSVRITTTTPNTTSTLPSTTSIRTTSTMVTSSAPTTTVPTTSSLVTTVSPTIPPP